MNKQIIEEAAEWFVELSTGDADPGTKHAFDAWLRKSPEHVRMYLELLPIWDDAAIPLPLESASSADLIALARGNGNVVPLEPAAHARHEATADLVRAMEKTQESPARPSGRRFAFGRLALAASLLLVVGGLALWQGVARAPVYATDLGEQRSLKLPDGSTVELNTQSRLRVHFTDQTRALELLEGQALFRVAKDAQRPFIVTSDATRVRALGTQFDIYRRNTGTTVTVLEGRVAVGSSKGFAPTRDAASAASRAVTDRMAFDPPVFLSAGEQITVATTTQVALAAPIRANVATATAWTQGRLIFDATPLPQVAEEFNRYNERRIVIEDAALSAFHVSGSFGSSDPASLLRFIEAQPGLTVHETASKILISRK